MLYQYVQFIYTRSRICEIRHVYDFKKEGSNLWYQVNNRQVMMRLCHCFASMIPPITRPKHSDIFMINTLECEAEMTIATKVYN